ncbi:MAG: four helix bundle protein [Candidatus Cloacimonetes bacterium]|nr:four helix bundle protein [Candidatus Cloacimonadota bacterium]
MSELIQDHGGYRKLLGFQKARLIYDITVRFCELYVSKHSRTTDQMVQAARSGVQNIAEGSQASATSKKTEIKLTQVARASLEELKLDYEDFLRQRDLPQLEPDNPILVRLKKSRCDSLVEFQAWVRKEKARQNTNQGNNYLTLSVPESLPSSAIVANGVLSLLNLTCYLLDKQVHRLANDFLNDGGFSERLYRERSKKRDGNN